MEYLTREKMEEELKKVEQAYEQEQMEEVEPEEQAEELPEQTQALQQEEEKGSQESSIEKALRDTKAWATRLAQENAALRKIIQEFQQGGATKQELKDAYENYQKVEDALEAYKQKLYEDYPEFKDVLEPIIEKHKVFEQELNEIRALKTELSRNQFIQYFETVVKPQILQVYPDFDDIIFVKQGEAKVPNFEFFEWAMAQPPALRFAATQSSHPQDIIWALTEYKKFKSSDTAKAEIEKQQKKQLNKMQMMMSMKSKNTQQVSQPELKEEELSVEEWIKRRNREVYGR